MQNESQIQLGQDGRLRHLLTLEDLNKNIIENILHTAKRFVISKKISEKEKKIFQSSTVANLFFEPSTRTRGSFEIASKLLGCNSINIDINNAQEKKGETWPVGQVVGVENTMDFGMRPLQIDRNQRT